MASQITSFSLEPPAFSRLSISMHWLMLALLAAVYACIELRELYPRGSNVREALKTWHFMLGLSVFALVWVRLIVRARSPRRPRGPGLRRWRRPSTSPSMA